MPVQHEKSEFVQDALAMLNLKTQPGGRLYGCAVASRPLAARPKPSAGPVVAACTLFGFQKLPRQQLFSTVRGV